MPSIVSSTSHIQEACKCILSHGYRFVPHDIAVTADGIRPRFSPVFLLEKTQGYLAEAILTSTCVDLLFEYFPELSPHLTKAFDDNGEVYVQCVVEGEVYYEQSHPRAHVALSRLIRNMVDSHEDDEDDD